MQSEIVNGGGYYKCFKFWFNMNSRVATNMGTLNVWIRSIKTNQEELMWSVKYNQTGLNEWKEGRFAVERPDQYQIVFEGIKGVGSSGNIALDDLNLFESSYCNTYSVNANPNIGFTTAMTTTLLTKPNTFVWVSESQYDCNFEEGFCLWQHDATSDFEWLRNKNSYLVNTGKFFFYSK